MDPAYSDAAIYNGTTNSWNIVAPMLEARNYFGMATTSFSASMLDTKNKPDGNRKNKVASTFVETDEAETVYAVGGYCCSSYPTYCFFSPLASTEKFDVLTGFGVKLLLSLILMQAYKPHPPILEKTQSSLSVEIAPEMCLLQLRRRGFPSFCSFQNFLLLFRLQTQNKQR